MDDFIGNRIKTLRMKRGLSMRQLASLAQISQGNLSAIESGNRQGGNITLFSAKRLAMALGVSIDYLAGMYEDPDAEEEDAA